MREDRHQSDQLLHTRLERVATCLHGIDISEADIAALRDAGVANLHVADVSQDGWSKGVEAEKFDRIIVSEVLEHVSNAGDFLQNLAAFASSRSADAVFTVPCAFNPTVLRHLLSNTEFVHPDHNYWFSFQTMTGLLEKHGWQVASLSTYSFDENRVFAPLLGARNKGSALTSAKWLVGLARGIPYRVVVRWLQKRSPFFADGLIILANPINT